MLRFAQWKIATACPDLSGCCTNEHYPELKIKKHEYLVSVFFNYLLNIFCYLLNIFCVYLWQNLLRRAQRRA